MILFFYNKNLLSTVFQSFYKNSHNFHSSHSPLLYYHKNLDILIKSKIWFDPYIYIYYNMKKRYENQIYGS